MRLDVLPRRLEITEGRLGRSEVQGNQAVGGVVHVHQQRALGRPRFEPDVLAHRSGPVHPGRPAVLVAGMACGALPR